MFDFWLALLILTQLYLAIGYVYKDMSVGRMMFMFLFIFVILDMVKVDSGNETFKALITVSFATLFIMSHVILSIKYVVLRANYSKILIEANITFFAINLVLLSLDLEFLAFDKIATQAQLVQMQLALFISLILIFVMKRFFDFEHESVKGSGK